MKRVRVVVTLHGGQFIHCWFQSRGEAAKFIDKWVEDSCRRIAEGKIGEMNYNVYCSADTEGRTVAAALGAWITAMYVADDAPTVAERAAKAMEKMVGQVEEGDEWKKGGDDPV